MGAIEDYIKEKAGGVGDDDIAWVLRNVKWIMDKLVGPLAKFAGQVRLFVEMLRDYQSGKYRQAPVWTLGVVAFALLYILMPLDLVPDFIPLMGLVDDALVMAAALSMVGEDLKAYAAWRDSDKKRTSRDSPGEHNPKAGEVP